MTGTQPGAGGVTEPGAGVRVRFAPSPTGDLHVGVVRTALFNWAYARNRGGTFVYRLEDTDASRSTEESYAAALDILRWLGLDWDEGPEIGGPFAPYRQSERLEIYADVLGQLQEQDAAYPCYCTPAEVQARTTERGGRPGYDGHCRELTPAQVADYQAQGRRPVMRFRMPPGSTSWLDAVRGEVTFDHVDVPDYALTRSDGTPLYTLAVTVDDLLMRITHVLRGEDLLSSTPRQIALLRALGVPVDRLPAYGHLPYVMGADNTKLSKRHGEVSIAHYRRQGYLPEAMLNYLALLGWSLGEDRELFSLAEMVAAFDELSRISRNPARFDVRKLDATNGEWIRRLDPADLRARMLPLLQAAGLVDEPPTPQQSATLDAAVPLAQTRMRRLAEAVDLIRPLLDDRVVLDPGDAAKTLLPDTGPVLAAAESALAAVPDWTGEQVEAALRGVLDQLGLKTKVGFPPLYVALTGRRTGLPLFDLVTLLGREQAVARLRAAREAVPA